MTTYTSSPTPYVYLMIEVYPPFTGDEEEYALRSFITLETWDDLEPRLEQAIEWYGKRQGFRLKWYAHSSNGAHDLKQRAGEWGYDSDDWCEPPTVGNEVI